MSERSVQCPRCPFQFAKLVDAGGYRAYHCPACEWTQATTDERPGNRPADVCGLCDTPIHPLAYPSDHHLYVGSGVVHGGGREYIPVHGSCLNIKTLSEGCPAYENAVRRIGERLVGRDMPHDPPAALVADLAARIDGPSPAELADCPGCDSDELCPPCARCEHLQCSHDGLDLRDCLTLGCDCPTWLSDSDCQHCNGLGSTTVDLDGADGRTVEDDRPCWWCRGSGLRCG